MKVALITGAIALLLSLHLSFLATTPWPTLVYIGPFAFLLLVGHFTRSTEHTLRYAAIGGLIPIAAFHAYFLYDIWVRLPTEGGGANIGLGLIYLALPFISGACMMAGRSVAAGQTVSNSAAGWWD